ncbi:pilus assembly protein [Cryobacterium melibiosiphilum]|uniref:Pilus assembly protein n=1 Tax=Cryobacterium melibiosiphilum TaxID=995039 RepID=A0A3A5MKD4_9MICO|nr:TadE/TadG family type IV pilus assembly protein [Cryobacterium melibiosiphilum]RJT88339.1 pilus assembly protein [Cryobacterium melibiosiphilum]
MLRAGWRQDLRCGNPADGGSAVAEFVMVVSLLTLLTLSVMQLALALHIRNTVLDAAAEGARFAALAGNTPGDGSLRTRDLIGSALGERFTVDVTASLESVSGVSTVAVRVRAPLPILGLLGPQHGFEVTGHGALEELE